MKIWNPMGHFAAARYGGRWMVVVGLAAALASGAAHAQAYVNATVGEQVAPGVYGRVNIGNGPAPALLFGQPVVVAAPPTVYAPRAPIYMYVPPGHAKHWSKHCARYGACNQPVYFLREPPRRQDHFHGHRDRHEWRHEGRPAHGRGDERRGHDHGHKHGRHDH